MLSMMSNGIHTVFSFYLWYEQIQAIPIMQKLKDLITIGLGIRGAIDLSSYVYDSSLQKAPQLITWKTRVLTTIRLSGDISTIGCAFVCPIAIRTWKQGIRVFITPNQIRNVLGNKTYVTLLKSPPYLYIALMILGTPATIKSCYEWYQWGKKNWHYIQEHPLKNFFHCRRQHPSSKQADERLS